MKPQFFAFRWITLLLSQEFNLPGNFLIKLKKRTSSFFNFIKKKNLLIKNFSFEVDFKNVPVFFV